MEVIDLRQPKKKEEAPEIPAVSDSPAPPPVPMVDTNARGLFTKEQVAATKLLYYFQRENGEIFTTSAVDAWNIKERRDKTLTFLGCTDGRVYRELMAKQRPLINRYQRLIDRDMRIYQRIINPPEEEIELEAKMTPDEVKAKHEADDERLEKIKSDQAVYVAEIAKLERVAFDADLARVKEFSARIPDFSVVGDEGGVQRFKEQPNRIQL